MTPALNDTRVNDPGDVTAGWRINDPGDVTAGWRINDPG